tara:strand:+ start:352 stop:618 length:267 start_codon:yes stop_codon:yes gene_type:complete
MEFYSKLDQKILQQAIRDIASKNPKTSTEALRYFTSDDFKKLCERNSINFDQVIVAIKQLNTYPIISKKKLANQISRLIEESFSLVGT